MPNLGSLWYTMGIKDLTDADLKKINDKLKNAGAKILLTPELAKSVSEILPKGIKLELDPQLKAVTNEMLAKAAEGKVMKVEVMPLITSLRKALREATKSNPPEMEVGVQSTKLRKLIESVLNKQGFMLNISTVNDNYSKVVQQKLNGRTYKVKIHADANEITRSVQASLMQAQSRYFGLQVSRNILYRSIDEALGQKRFNINIAVQHDQARKAVQDALLKAQVIGKDQALAYQRLQTGELKAAQAELAKLKAAHMGAADAARAHSSATKEVGNSLFSLTGPIGEVKSMIANLWSIQAAKEFLSQVIEIGGELEHQKIAMDTIFGDKGKTNELFGQIKGLARQSPFGVMELTKSVKALSAYGVQYNEIYDTAKRLADISAATSVDINRLILAFGKTKSRGFLDGLEAKQFAYANIPIYEMVRRKLEELEGQAVTTAQVMERMKKREIGFDIVKDVLWDMTDPGGKFYDMQEALAGSVKTSWKLVRDNIELMFGEIAESAVGSSLKSLAEILQGLTREWRTVGTVVGTAAIGLGVYKVAQIGVNQVMQQGTAKTYEELMAAKQRDAQRLRSLSLVTDLTAAEKARIATANKLTNAELAQAVKTEKLTLAQVEQLYVTGKLNKANVIHLFRMGLIDKANAKAILSNNRLSISLKGIGMAMASVGNAAKAFLLNPWTIGIAALTTLFGLWQRNSEEMSKAEEAGENIFTKADEGAKNLVEAIKSLGDATGASLDDTTLLRGIETMKNAIKDYSPTPHEDMAKALLNENGEVASLAEQYDNLMSQLDELTYVYEKAKENKLGDIFSESVKSADSGWFDDNVLTDIQDFGTQIKKAENAIDKFANKNKSEMRGIVDLAIKANNEFAKASEEAATYEAKFALLVKDFAESTIETADFKLDVEKQSKLRNLSAAYLSDVSKLNTAQKEAIAELTQTAELFKTKMARAYDIDFSKPLGSVTKKTIMIGLKDILTEIENLPEYGKPVMYKALQDIFGVDFEAEIISQNVTERFKKSLSANLGEIADKIRYGRELDEAERGKVEQLMRDAISQTKKLYPMWATSLQGMLDSSTFTARVDLAIGGFADDNKVSDLQKSLLAGEGLPMGKMKTQIDSWFRSVSNVYDLQNTIQSSIDAAYNNYLSAKNNKKLSKVEKNIAKQAYEDTIKAAEKLGFYGLTARELKSNKSKTEKDEFADSLKQRFKDIKDAWSEFQKWSKTEGREAASKRIGESGLFSTLSADQIPKTIEDYRALVKGLEDELRKAGVKGTAREGLLNDLLKQLLDIDKAVVDEQLKLALDKVSKEAERQLADWNLFDKIRKATGNQDLAMSIAFGMNTDAETDYPNLVKKQFAEVANQFSNMKGLTYDMIEDESWLTDAPDEVKKAWEDTTKKLQQYAREQKDAIADILNEYQSLQDKLAKIDSSRNRKIEMVNKSDMSAPDKAKYIQRINVEADYQKFTQSADYLKFFSGIYSLTMDKAQEIGDKIRMYLDQQLQDGSKSAEDYYKEIERINQQLTKLRNVKSDSLTFLTGGVKGLNQKKLEIADSNILAQMTKVQEAEEALEKAKASGDIKQVAAAELTLKLAKTELDTRLKIRDTIVKDMEAWQKVLDVVNIVGNIVGGMSDAFSTLRDMADAYGFDSDSNAWNTAAAVIDTLSTVTGGAQKVIQSAMSGDIGGIISGTFDTLLTPFTIWSKLHDKKLQKMIERSQEAAQIMQNQYDILEKRMANFLGNAANMKVEGYSGEGGAYGKQRELMQGQLAELEKQRQTEMDKKKSDNSVVEDYNKQIEEMKISIQDFAIEAANALYGIDLNGWAEQLGDTIVDAFARGEDAGEAFDKKVGDILRSISSKMISQDILAPMFGDLRNFLFGENGMSGAFGADFKLDASEMAAMKTYLDKIKDEGIPAAEELFNAINEATGGILNETDATKSGLSAGIQALTEDTGSLLASYFNAFRADASEQTHVLWPRLLDDVLPQMNVIAQSQLDTQRQIAENTLRTAQATEAIVKSNDDISRLLTRVSQGGAKWHI